MRSRGRGLFVIGTDTGVGKTEISCGLLRAYARQGKAVVGMKPVAAGLSRTRAGLRNADVEALRRESTVRAARALTNSYAFVPPIAPHIAARDASVDIRADAIVRAFRALAMRADVVVVEGVGGFRVPLAPRFDTADLAVRLRLPLVLVVGMRLGCLSHALLTIEAIEARGLALAGWVANRIDPRMRRYRENVSALRERVQAPLLGEIPYCDARRRRTLSVDARLDLAALACIA